MTAQDGVPPQQHGGQSGPHDQAPYAPARYPPTWYGQPVGQPPPGQVPYGYPPVVLQRTNGLAVASLVLGILWLYWIGSVLALVFGYVAKKQIRERGEGGGGLATAGIVLGWVGVGILTLAVAFGLAAFGLRSAP